MLPVEAIESETHALQAQKQRYLDLIALRKEVSKLAREALPMCDAALKMAVVKQETSVAYGVPVEVIEGRRRTEEVALARQVCCYVAREATLLPLSEIGKHLGGKDHGTALHAHGRIKDLMDVSKPPFQTKVLGVLAAVKRRLDAAPEGQEKLL